jgi:hypothetical protein
LILLICYDVTTRKAIFGGVRGGNPGETPPRILHGSHYIGERARDVSSLNDPTVLIKPNKG